MITVLERYITGELLASSPLGKVAHVVPGSHCVFLLPEFAPVVVDGLWVQLVLDLTERKLVRGILDVPMVQQNDHTVIWVKDFQILCYAKRSEYSSRLPIRPRPSLPSAVTLAIGGPTGVGKTTLVRRLLASAVGESVMQYVAYTTRPPRSRETDGVDYHFVEPAEMQFYQHNPHFTGFIEARGYWYWIEPASFFKVRWSTSRAIHVFSITQVHEFLARRDIAPDLQWIWLDASPMELRRRLEGRGDNNVDQSLTHNVRLEGQDRAGLVSLHLNTEVESIEDSLRRLLDFIIGSLRGKP